MWPILKIDARTQTEAAPDEQTEMRCRSANQSLITDVFALRPYFCTIRPPPDRTAKAVRRSITAFGALDGGHQTYRRNSTVRKGANGGTCTAAKAQHVEIYTVLVMAGNSTPLQNCATDSGKYFALTTAGAIITTFNQIGQTLANLHLSR